MTDAKSTDNLFAKVLPAAAAASTAPTETKEAITPAEATETQTDEPAKMTELDMLKSRATMMGITFSNNIGVDSLKARIQEKMDGDNKQATQEVAASAVVTQAPEPVTTVQAAPVIKNSRQEMFDKQMKLVRLRITNLDPKKKDLAGEIITVANKVLGTVKKFIPFGEATENGYHVPYVLYRQLQERQFLNIKTRKDSRGRTIVETGMAREFALEVLPPLTEIELGRLAAAQSAAAGQD